MDTVVKKIIKHSNDILDNPLSGELLDELKKRVADSLVVSFGAMRSEPVVLEKKALLPANGKHNAHIYFSNEKASVDTAAFINGTMTRYLDFNDTYLSKEALHPSDNIPPMLSIGDAFGLSVMQILKGVNMAYDVVCSLSDVVSIRDRGWDHVTYDSISSASGLGLILNLDETKFENLLGLAINNNISLRQTRAGELSMWKGCTAANASRNSVFAAVLAQEGLSGPSPIFEGEFGFFKQVSGAFDLDITYGKVLKTMIKNYPVEYHAMSAAEAAESLHKRLRGVIQGVTVETFEVANKIIIKDPEKRRPRTRETADHSMPFIIAYTLLHGAPTPDTFQESYFEEKSLLDLIDRTDFNVTEKYNEMYPEYLPVKITVKTDRMEETEEVIVPKGHFRNPYSWDDLKRKAQSLMGEERAKEIIDFCKGMEKRQIDDLFELLSQEVSNKN